MKMRSLALACAALAALAAPAAAEEKEKPKAPTYKTPQEVFDAAEKAAVKPDWKTLVHCYTPRAQGELVAAVAFLVGRRRAELLAGKDAEELKKGKSIFDLMDKHGLTSTAFEKIEKALAKDKDEGKATKSLLGLLEDPVAFVDEVATAAGITLPFEVREYKEQKKLTDVKIDGDKATGTVVFTWTDKHKKKHERKESITFKKVGGGWRIDEEGKPAKKDRK